MYYRLRPVYRFGVVVALEDLLHYPVAPTDGIFPVLLCLGGLNKVARHPLNDLAAVEQRINKIAPPVDIRAQRLTVREVVGPNPSPMAIRCCDWFLAQLPPAPQFDNVLTVKEWVDKWKVAYKARRYAAGYANFLAGHTDKKMSTMCKHDETLPFKVVSVVRPGVGPFHQPLFGRRFTGEVQTFRTIVPRSLAISTTSDNLQVGRWMLALFEWLKLMSRQVMFGDWIWRIASGLEPQEMDEVASTFKTVPNCLLSCGDDQALQSGGEEFEYDVSKADQAQQDDAMYIEEHVMRFAGIPEWVIDIMQAEFLGPLLRRMKRHGWKVIVHREPQRTTGSTNTAGGVTLFFGVVILFALCHGVHPRHLPLFLMREFQINLKVPVHSAITFLRSWFVEGSNGWRLLPLPSRCLKVGKLLVDPRTLVPRGMRSKAYQMVAYSLAANLQSVPYCYPVLGALRASLERFGLPHEYQWKLHEEQYYVDRRRTDAEYDRAELVERFCARYSVTPMQLYDLERRLFGLREFPCVIVHEVVDAMADVDYEAYEGVGLHESVYL
jgi:hypothetical protein